MVEIFLRTWQMIHLSSLPPQKDRTCCQSLFCKKLNNSSPDVFVDMVTSHHCFHWERCHLWSNLVVIFSSACGILTNGHVLIGRPLNVHAHPAACACVHAVDHVKFVTMKICSQGILVNYAKIYTSENFLLYSSAIATAALTRWFVVYRSTGKGHTNFPLPLSTVILWQVLTATGFAALHVCSLLKARFATLCSCLELCPPLSLTMPDEAYSARSKTSRVAFFEIEHWCVCVVSYLR